MKIAIFNNDFLCRETPVKVLRAAGFWKGGGTCTTSAHVIIIIEVSHPFRTIKVFFACNPQRDSSKRAGLRQKKNASSPPTGMIGTQTLSAPASSCTRFPDVMSGNQVQDDGGLGEGCRQQSQGNRACSVNSRPLPKPHPIFVKVALTVHPHIRGGRPAFTRVG